MRASYIIEYRYSGFPRTYFKNEFWRGAKRYKFCKPQFRYVPHLTLAGPINVLFERSLIKKIEKVVYKHAPLIHKPGNLIHTGKYRHFETPEGKHVIYVDIIPPKQLVKLKTELEEVMGASWFTKIKTYATPLWHTTLWLAPAHNRRKVTASHSIWRWARHRKPQEMKFILDRVALIKKGRIVCEFDLVNKKTLSRMEALDNNARYDSYMKIKNELEEAGEHFEYKSNPC